MTTTTQIDFNPEAEAKAEEKTRRRPRAKAKIQSPKIVFKNEKEMRHDVYKADVKKFLRNTSWIKNQVDIERFEHTHIYHNISSQCKKMKYTNAVGGHFHEVTVEIGEDGSLNAKCGPPLCFKHRRLPNGGFQKIISEVSWFDGYKNQNIIDDHVHYLEYQHSEMINVNSAKKIRNIAAEESAAMDNIGLKDMG